MKTFKDYILPRLQFLGDQEHVFAMFAYLPDRPVYVKGATGADGDILMLAKPKDNKAPVRYGYFEGDQFHELVASTSNPRAPFGAQDTIMVDKGDLENISKSMETTVGRFLLNAHVIAGLFGSRIDYINEPFNPYKIGTQLGQIALDHPEETKTLYEYLRRGNILGSYGDLFACNMSERSVSVSPEILKRRDELIAKHADELNDAKVVAAIEKELIDIYIEYIGDDSSRPYLSVEGKSFNIHMKKTSIMVGGLTPFGEGSTGVTTITKSLAEGWEKESFDQYANEIRSGSYARGVETQKGGAETNLVLRAARDIQVTEDDCKDKHGITVTLDDTISSKIFIGRHHIVDGKSVLITAASHARLQGKVIQVRTPMSCKTVGGLCFTCLHENFKKLGIAHPGTAIIEVTSTFMGLAMKKMHGTSIDVKPFNYEDFFA